jgi:hypothetical protein
MRLCDGTDRRPVGCEPGDAASTAIGTRSVASERRLVPPVNRLTIRMRSMVVRNRTTRGASHSTPSAMIARNTIRGQVSTK